MVTKREQRELTTAALLGIATELFARRGYASVGLEDVAAAAGVTRGAVYHHFGSKLGLFRAVVESVHRDIADDVERAAESAGDAWDRLEAGSHAFVDAAAHPRRRRVLLVDGPAVLGWQEWRALDAENSERMLFDVLAESDVDDTVGPALTVMLSGAMNEAALWIAREGAGSGDVEAAHAALERILHAARQAR